MDFTKLRSFSCVAETGSLSKAAQVLMVSQPALSRQILVLERELGTKLFTRSSDGMAITRRGEIALRRARRILLELEGMKSEQEPQGSAR